MTIKKKKHHNYVLCTVESSVFKRHGGNRGRDREDEAPRAPAGGTGVRLPPEVKREERTTGAAWAGWGWTQAPWSETES